MKKGSQPFKILNVLRKSGRKVISRRKLATLAAGISHPDRAISRLVEEGFAEKLDRAVWLVPSGRRPNFDIPRFWSNPDLQDPLKISALVVRNPTMRDMTRMVLAYGTGPANRALEEMETSGEISPVAVDRARQMLRNTVEGLSRAAA